MGRTIGIDIGTTNSCVAVMEGGVPVIIANSEGGRTTPSIVGFTSTGTPVIGAPAKNQMITNPENTVYSIMRHMGHRYSEVGDDIGLLPYRVIHHGDDIRIDAVGRSYSPEEVSAFIIEKMKKTAEEYLGEAVSEAVIAVPIPCRKSQIFSTVADGQTEASMHILEGESKLANKNRTISRFILAGIPVAPHSVPRIEIYFDIDAHSTLRVSAKDLDTGKELRTSIESSNSHNENDIGCSGNAKQGLSVQSPGPK